MNYEEVIVILRAKADPRKVVGMARFGINTDAALGIGISFLRQLGNQIGRDHDLARQLWESYIHEARILADGKRSGLRQPLWAENLWIWITCCLGVVRCP